MIRSNRIKSVQEKQAMEQNTFSLEFKHMRIQVIFFVIKNQDHLD
jgi:hypothetical protein